MILSFGDRATEDLFHGTDSKAARKISKELWPRIRAQLDLLNAAVTLEDLKTPPASRLEKLRGVLEGFYSIRVNEQYRLVFKFQNRHCSEVRCTDYH